MTIKGTAVTHTGRRDNNEDAHCFAPELGLYAVADGMGGYEGGEIASMSAIEAIEDFVRRNKEDGGLTWPWGVDSGLSYAENLVAGAIRLAHETVIARKTGKLSQMGTTVAMLLIQGRQVIIAHVGDSRVYRLRGGELSQMTQDHSLINEMRAAGLPADDNHPYKNVITRALGFKARACDADLRREPVACGDTYLLCTDGLLESLDDDQIKAALCADNPEVACEKLVQQAYARGSKDNITALVVRI